MLSGLFIGTSGWSYKHWIGVFYPENLKPVQLLEYYFSQFDCVELNSSFYHLPKKSTVEGWLKRTPESFLFCPKLSRFITHRQRLVHVENSLKKFFDVFAGLKAKLGPVLIQLPPGLSYNQVNVCSFLKLLSDGYSDYRFAIEVRHKSWICEEFNNLLCQYGIAFVIADSGNRFPYHEDVTADFIYLRFHGPENLYASDYTEEKLVGYATKISGWLIEGKEVWAFFNNDFGGYAIKNAARLKELVNSL
jgi:uncharacterized protein YecE (DUF72 family)